MLHTSLVPPIMLVLALFSSIVSGPGIASELEPLSVEKSGTVLRIMRLPTWFTTRGNGSAASVKLHPILAV